MKARAVLSVALALWIAGVLYFVSVRKSDGQPTCTTTVAASRAAIAPAVAAASNGDVICVLAGTATDWTSTLSVTKNITLLGAGIDVTIIQDNVPGFSALLSMSCAGLTNGRPRVTGITFEDGPGTTERKFNGVVTAGGSTTGDNGCRFRADHNEFDQLDGANVFTSNIFGVVDHNVFTMRTGNSIIPVYIYHREFNGGFQGDGSWVAPTDWGGEQRLFIEENIFTHPTDRHYTIGDAYQGARYVVRNNLIVRGWVEGHGTDSGQRQRGTRAIEVYRNRFFGTNEGPGEGGTGGAEGDRVINSRSGSVMAWGNAAFGYGGPAANFRLDVYRGECPFIPWGPADGTSIWDVNLADPGVSGTASGGGSSVMTVAGTPWTPNQWVGYTLRQTSSCTTTSCASLVTSNTANTVTTRWASACNGTQMVWAAGKTYDFKRIDMMLDQAGRIGGDIPDTLTPTGWLGGGSNPQTTEPLLESNNYRCTTAPPTLGCTQAGDINWSSGAPSQIRSGEHFINNVPFGTLAARPAEPCPSNTYYMATDGAEWDATRSGNEERWYKCVGSAWTVYATPYCNPHPLTTGGVCTAGGSSTPSLRLRNRVRLEDLLAPMALASVLIARKGPRRKR